MPNYLPGKESTEYRMAVRAEALGSLLLVLGISLAYGLTPWWAGMCVALLGCILDIAVLFAYHGTRGRVKAAAVSPPNVTKLRPRGF